MLNYQRVYLSGGSTAMFGTSILVAGPFQASSAWFRWGYSGRFETRFETHQMHQEIHLRPA